MSLGALAGDATLHGPSDGRRVPADEMTYERAHRRCAAFSVPKTHSGLAGRRVTTGCGCTAPIVQAAVARSFFFRAPWVIASRRASILVVGCDEVARKAQRRPKAAADFPSGHRVGPRSRRAAPVLAASASFRFPPGARGLLLLVPMLLRLRPLVMLRGLSGNGGRFLWSNLSQGRHACESDQCRRQRRYQHPCTQHVQSLLCDS